MLHKEKFDVTPALINFTQMGTTSFDDYDVIIYQLAMQGSGVSIAVGAKVDPAIR